MSQFTPPQHTPLPDDNDHLLSTTDTPGANANDISANSPSLTNTSNTLMSTLAADSIADRASDKKIPIIVVYLRALWRMLTMNNKVTIGSAIVSFFVIVAIFGPLFIRQDPNSFSPDALMPPSSTHWFGTTYTGQDVFAQLVVGARSSILWGIITGVLVTVISVVVGLAGGYFGGFIDELLSLFTNVFLVLPAFPLAVVLAAYFPFKGPLSVSLVIVITSWAWGARVLRAQTLSMRNREFVEAARATGETTWRIIFYELLPNEIAIVVAGFIGTMLYVILAAAGLEFLGLGDINNVSWGSMFYWIQNNDAIVQGAWWWFLPPGLCIALLGAGLAFINFGIDEVADPRLRRAAKKTRRRKKKKTAAPLNTIAAE